MPTMANNLTGLIPTLFQSLDTVSREMIGIIPAVSRSSVADRKYRSSAECTGSKT